MIQLQTNLNSVSVAINPKLVTHVTQAPTGCKLYFVSGETVHVKNDYLEVVGILIAQQ